MSEKQPSSTERPVTCDSVISSLARVARAVVYYDKSYDIIDELNRMADNPDKVLQLLGELSRVVLKVFDDVRDYVNSEGKGSRIEGLFEAMRYWSKNLEDFERDCLNPQNVRKLASLSLVPDKDALDLSEALGK